MKINVSGFDVYPQVLFAGTRGSYGAEAVLEFEFEQGWNDLLKCVCFYPADGGDAVSVVLGSDTKVKIPAEIMRCAGQAKYVLSGTKGEDTMISVTGVLQIAQTLDAAGIAPDEVTPSLTEQVLSKVNAAESAANTAKEAAERCDALIEEYVIDTESARVNADAAAESAKQALEAKNDTEKIKESVIVEEEARIEAEKERLANEEKREAAENARSENYGKLSNTHIGRKNGEFVKIDDISPVEHEIDVKIENFTKDMSSVKLVRYGKAVYGADKFTVSGGGSWPWTKNVLCDLSVPAGTYTFSCKFDQTGESISTVSVEIRDIDAVTIPLCKDVTSEEKQGVLTSVFEIPKGVRGFRIYLDSNVGEDKSILTRCIFEDIQIEFGSRATEYESYLEPTEYTADENGEFKGVTSLYPITALLCDTAGVTINATYNRDANKAASSLEKKMSNNANALVGVSSGELIRIDDVSPLEHELEVKLSGADDPKTVKLKRYGTNLIPYPYAISTIERFGIMWTDKGDGTWTANGTAERQSYVTSQWFTLPKGTYTLSGAPEGGDGDTYFVNISNKTYSVYYEDTGNGATFTLSEDTELRVGCIIQGGVTADNFVFKAQLEAGEGATEYEPYVEPTEHIPKADGSVEGVTSHYPTTTLVTDAGVNISVTYNKDANKVIASLEKRIAALEER